MPCRPLWLCDVYPALAGIHSSVSALRQLPWCKFCLNKWVKVNKVLQMLFQVCSVKLMMNKSLNAMVRLSTVFGWLVGCMAGGIGIIIIRNE